MGPETITLILEKKQDSVCIKPLRISNGEIINTTNCILFNPSHICDENGCDCTLSLKVVNSNILNVVDLNLSKCNLTSIPDSLHNVPLKFLNLSHNLLKDIPNCLLKGLNTLENLNLSYNFLKEFEMKPQCALNLRVLDLTNNGIKFIPIWIVHAKCRNLIELHYSNNILGKTNESLFNKVYVCNLKKMILRNCYIINENISFIKSIQSVQCLDVSNNVSSEFSNIFTNYEELFTNPAWKTTMEVLNLSRLSMAFLPDSMGSLMSLKELYLSENKMYWLPDFIGNLINLKILDISNNSICFLPNTFSGLRNLHTLKCQHNNLSNCQILDSLPFLSILDLYENDLDQFDLDVLKYDYLDLENNYFATNSLNHTYSTKRENYRKEFNLTKRKIGFHDSHSDISSSSSDDEEKHFGYESDVVDDRNITPTDEYLEECWDDKKIPSHPDVTSSDDEWQGFYPIKKYVVKPKQNLDHLLKELYEDVD